MQIRIANRQDEAPVRALLESQGVVLDMPGGDQDLRNLDHNYFGHDGLFVVAEEDGKVIAFAGARKVEGEDDILELTRMTLPSTDKATAESGTTCSEIKERFLAIIKNHAYQMDYKKIQVKKEIESSIV